MGLEFISRIIRTTLLLAVLIALFGSVYFDWLESVGVLVGAVWGVANLYFLRSLVVETLTPKKTRKLAAIIWGIFKFPVLYGAGYFVLAAGWFSPASLLIGFSLIFLVAVLKVLGRLVTRMDSTGINYYKQPEGNS